MGLLKRKGKSKSGWTAITEGIKKLSSGNAPDDPTTQARSAEDFGAIEVDDFENFEGANIAALRNAHSNQRRQFAPMEGEVEGGEEEGDDADVRIGDDADLSGSRKRKRSPTGAAGTSSLSPSIRI